MTNGEAKQLIRAILSAAGAPETSVTLTALSANGPLPPDFHARLNLLNKRGFIRCGINDVLVTDDGAKFVA
jgi:hypothetical protein